MRIEVINTGFLKLDGGAMFGVVPKTLWQRRNQPDENNLCRWAMRCLLVETGNRRMLIDTGLGDKQNEKFFSYFQPHGEDTLQSSLNNLGLGFEDITDVILTHLHFDHCGGAVSKKGDQYVTTFPNATYWTDERHWNWAIKSNPREKASFLKENFLPIQESGQLQFAADGQEIAPGLSVRAFFGHTEAMMVPHIRHKDRTLVYLADLQPSVAHFPLPWVMSYDVRPLTTISERGAFLKEAVEKDYLFFFEHDPVNECCSLKQTEKGVREDQIFMLRDWA